MLLATDGIVGLDLPDALRSLGALLDGVHGRAVAIVLRPDGFLIRALVAPEPGAQRTPIERVFTRSDILEQRFLAIARRGTGHVAGPIERALRVIGLMAVEQGLVEHLVIVQVEGGWSVSHRSSSTADHRLIHLRAEEVDRRDREARTRRARSGGVATPKDTSLGAGPLVAGAS
jgi:hypothetical protein